ncbi:hypothetical protein ACP4OV_025454 [Aristida adscensionis]
MRWELPQKAAGLSSSCCSSSISTSKISCTAPPNSSALAVVHRHGPCSPLLARGGAPPSHAEVLDRDQGRVDSMHRRIAVAGGAAAISDEHGVTLPAWRGTDLGTNNYVVSVGLGTPARRLSVEFDTGSDLLWVQCTPCTGCYEQRDPLFDPAESPTCSAVPCGSPECRKLDSPGCSSDQRCRYEFANADGSYTGGDLVRDALTLTPRDGIPGFVFGCGHGDAGSFGETDGLVGLGRGALSLASQAAAASKRGAGFSYCLPSSAGAAGYLSLGGDAPANARFTAMTTAARGGGAMPSLYYLDLVGITVGGEAVEVPAAVFAAAGTIIDSGTVISRLPASAYAALRSAFSRHMGDRYKRAPPLRTLDTCYDFTGVTTVRVPAVALVFAGGATVSLDAGGVLYVASASQACLAFAANADETSIGILGNAQQKTLAVVHDVANQRIGFGANGCS